jgi:O-glycosyl hydrolase
MTLKYLKTAVICVWLSFVPLALAQGPGTTSRITVNPQERFQMIDGFGVNYNSTFFREAQRPMLDMLIDDLGATIFRLDPYGVTSWEVTNDNDDPHVMNWEYYNDRYSIPQFEASWAAARYLNSRGIRPFMTLSGTVPDWMLDDKAPPPKHHVCREGTGILHPLTGKPPHLNPAMYEEFAETAVSMLVYARTKARIDFEYFSPVNETDCYPVEGPRVDPEEMPRLLGAIARRLNKEGLGDVKLVVADQSSLANDYMGPILADDALMKQVGVFSLHSYGSDSMTSQVERLRASKYPETHVWLTEYGDLNDLDKSLENDWKNFALKATWRALRALNQGANAALFWDAYDNYQEHDARLTFYGLIRNADHIYTPKKRYYAAKQLYRFVRPGSQRIAAQADAPGLTVSAFRNGATNSLVIVGIKQGGPNRIEIALSGTGPEPPAWELYATTRNVDCLKLDTVAIRNGVAQIELPEEAIFTLVGTVK